MLVPRKVNRVAPSPEKPVAPALDYAKPRRPNLTGVRRLTLALGLALLHWCVGVGLVAIFNNTRFIDAAVLAFLFPFGWGAMRVNPRKMFDAAVGNSIFCGFVLAYALTFCLNRTRSHREPPQRRET